MANLKEFTGKERMLIDWMSVRNAILRADTGEMKITHHKNEFVNGIVGVVVELVLNFSEPVPPGFTEDEKSAIDAAKKQKDGPTSD
jgi:hypothetical protein